MMMNWLKTLTVKPWIAEQAEPHGETRLVVQGQDASKLTAFKFCLAVVTVIFFLFTITFIQRTQSFDFQPLAGEAWLPFTDTSLLWRSTILLALASLALQLAIWQARKSIDAEFAICQFVGFRISHQSAAYLAILRGNRFWLDSESGQ